MMEHLECPPKTNCLDLERFAFLDLIRMSNTMADPEEIARQLVVVAQHLSECEAVAIRLKVGPGYPYLASLGFPECFLAHQDDLCAKKADGHLLRDEHRNPVLACLCGRVLLGQVDRSQPGFTDRGSFVTGATSELPAAPFGSHGRGHLPDRRRDLLPCTGSLEQQCTPNRRHFSGYESVGLFPIRLEQVTYGLIQCNDRHRDRFTTSSIDLLENLAVSAAHLFQLVMV